MAAKAAFRSGAVSRNPSTLNRLRCKMTTSLCSGSCPCETWDRKVAVDELAWSNSRCSRSLPGHLLSRQCSGCKFGTGPGERAIAVQTGRSFSIGIRLRSANFARRLAGGVPAEFHRHHDRPGEVSIVAGERRRPRASAADRLAGRRLVAALVARWEAAGLLGKGRNGDAGFRPLDGQRPDGEAHKPRRIAWSTRVVARWAAVGVQHAGPRKKEALRRAPGKTGRRPVGRDLQGL